jgi:hypothetical protein
MCQMDLTRYTALWLWSRIRYDKPSYDWEVYLMGAKRKGKGPTAGQQRALREVLDQLDYPERLLMIKRWGLHPDHPQMQTLEECTNEYEWSTAHAYQLERKALRHMREHLTDLSLDLLWGGRSKS